jgi:hypothetical protein
MEIELKNQSIIDDLENFRTSFYNLFETEDEKCSMSSIGFEYNPDIIRNQCSEERLNEIVSTETDRAFPLDFYATPLSILQEKGQRLDKWQELYNRIRYELPISYGLNSTALINRYPRGGLTGWHTNSNSAGYQFLFTWSETGEGAFIYRDNDTNQIVTIQDRPGWQARWYLFSDDPEKLCWHSCYTDCERITIAMKINHAENTVTEEMRNDFLEELSTP